MKKYTIELTDEEFKELQKDLGLTDEEIKAMSEEDLARHIISYKCRKTCRKLVKHAAEGSPKSKLANIKKLADAMYYAAQNITTDASRLHKAMDEYHKFIIYECKEEPVSEDLEEEINRYLSYRSSSPLNPIEFNRDLARHFANWQKEQMMKEPVSEGFEEVVRGLWNELNTGHTYSIIGSYNIFYGICLDIANWQKEQFEKERLKHCDELK